MITHRSGNRPYSAFSRAVLRVLSIAALTALTACSATTAGHPQERLPDKSDVPATSYDVALYLCDEPNSTPRCPDRVATSAEQAALSRRLRADPSVSDVLYLSQDDAYHLGQNTLPDRADLEPGDLPASFFVTLTDGSGLAAFNARYSRIPGVGLVIACRGKPNCSVKTLRDAGLIH